MTLANQSNWWISWQCISDRWTDLLSQWCQKLLKEHFSKSSKQERIFICPINKQRYNIDE